MDVFFLHFCAHMCTSYFFFDQLYAFVRRSSLSRFKAIGISLAVALAIGVLYKGAEYYLVGHALNFWQSVTYNVVGVVIAMNKNLLTEQ